MCKRPTVERASQLTLRFAAIEEAVAELAAGGEFRTKDVAQHPAVHAAHPSTRDDPRFNQHIGTYLTDATGRLGIEQVSEKGKSNASWRRKT